MTRTRRRSSRKTSPQQTVAIRQLERKQLCNRFALLEALDEEQIEFIHNVSLRILEEEGIEILGEQALNVFKKAGASVDDNGVVRIEREQLLEIIAQAPETFTL
ncbi:MAG TPA: methyltransferase, partial [Gammaproteobacteria bacterium]|nr:methyltransferase [Gammaproteobacteria bacterium]